MYGSSDFELSHLNAQKAISDFAASADQSNLVISPDLYEGGYEEDTYGAAGFDPEPVTPKKVVNSVEDVDELGKKRALISPWQAGWNITNAIQGMFIVSLPYTVLHGGWWALFGMVAVAYICYYTGLVLVECLYDDDGSRVRQSYRAIAEHCWGSTWAGRLVLSAQMLELLMTCILYVVICGDLLESSFSSATINKMGWMLLCTALLIPCAFIGDIVIVSQLSFWNTISHVIINLIVIAYCCTEASNWSFSSIRFSFDIKTFPTVLGIIVFSYTSHIFLPTLECSMKNRSEFKPMLLYSHLFAAIFKALFAVVGFLTFGEFTQEEVTNNLPSQGFKIVINIILVIKALLSYPLPYYTIVDLLTKEYFRGQPTGFFPACFSPDGGLREWALALRICVVLFILFMAISIPHFALLMGLVGNITGTMLSFIWPSIFHLQMKRHRLSKYKFWFDVSVIGIGATFCVSGLFYSSMELHRAIYNEDEYL